MKSHEIIGVSLLAVGLLGFTALLYVNILNLRFIHHSSANYTDLQHSILDTSKPERIEFKRIEIDLNGN